jgi:hypothetical protein
MVKKDIDFRFCPAKSTKLGVGIEILTGDYTGVKYVYGAVKALTDDNSDEELVLNFEYVIEDDAGLGVKELEKDENFGNHLGQILQEIIINELDKQIRDENGPATEG